MQEKEMICEHLKGFLIFFIKHTVYTRIADLSYLINNSGVHLQHKIYSKNKTNCTSL